MLFSFSLGRDEKRKTTTTKKEKRKNCIRRVGKEFLVQTSVRSKLVRKNIFSSGYQNLFKKKNHRIQISQNQLKPGEFKESI